MFLNSSPPKKTKKKPNKKMVCHSLFQKQALLFPIKILTCLPLKLLYFYQPLKTNQEGLMGRIASKMTK